MNVFILSVCLILVNRGWHDDCNSLFFFLSISPFDTLLKDFFLIVNQTLYLIYLVNIHDIFILLQ